MPSSFDNAGLFLINTIFDTYIFVWVIRFILACVHADYFNPISQIVIKLTQPTVTVLQRILPRLANIELSTLFSIFILETFKFLLVGLLTSGVPMLVGLVLLAIGEMLHSLLNAFFYAILLQAILSWIQGGSYSPLASLLSQITRPLLQPLRRLIPPVAGFDLTAIPALIGLRLLTILCADPLVVSGMAMAFG